MQVWNEERIAKLCLSSCPAFGSRTLRKLWTHFHSTKSAWLASHSELTSLGIQESSVIFFRDWRKTFDTNNLLQLLEREKIDVLFRDDSRYPQTLQTSSDPPEILFLRGSISDRICVAVVGTRKITSYGKQCIDHIIPEVVRAGITIVSGLALGVDGAAHASTIESRGTTFAILGTGIDDASIYPREHFALAHRIINEEGALLSEFPPGTEGVKYNFPMRNRLIASLALATLVIEADEKSGSLITAKLALEENHEVLAVPGPIWSDGSRGTNALLKSGARVCTSADDVLAALAIDRPELIAHARATLPIDPTEQRLLDILIEPKHTDALAEIMELDIANTSAKLTLLEMKGLIKSLGGQTWIKTKK